MQVSKVVLMCSNRALRSACCAPERPARAVANRGTIVACGCRHAHGASRDWQDPEGSIHEIAIAELGLGDAAAIKIASRR
jgi:hypothetical protein